MLPLASTSAAPCAWKNAPALSTESAVVPRPIPNGTPALWQASAALRKTSRFQLPPSAAAAGYKRPDVDAGMLP